MRLTDVESGETDRYGQVRLTGTESDENGWYRKWNQSQVRLTCSQLRLSGAEYGETDSYRIRCNLFARSV